MARVFVGMSGGVDSSLSAALLKEQGHDVVGVYMKNWTEDLPGMKCPWADDLADAKRVAVQLGIDFRVFDFEKEYKHKVVDYMIEEYKFGRTPNPDIMCNQEVKFKLFLEAALEQGADMIATGHYARVDHTAGPAISSAPENLSGKQKAFSGAAPRDVTHGSHLLRAKDDNKDQTYFLYRVTEEALSKTLFPLGGFTKPEVRTMAEERGLSTAGKKESMGICFVGQVGIRDFLGQYVEAEPGDIIDKATGKVIGRHDGAIFYTLGQRHGLDLGGGLPYYVTDKDMLQNIVYVSQNIQDETMWRGEVRLKDIHWINSTPADGSTLHVRIRHRAPLVPCRLQGSMLILEEPQRALAAGQSAVLYDGQVCIGGGIVA